MEIDQDRSGHFKENILSITFMGSGCDIGMDFNSEEAKELQKFLNEVLE